MGRDTAAGNYPTIRVLEQASENVCYTDDPDRIVQYSGLAEKKSWRRGTVSFSLQASFLKRGAVLSSSIAFPILPKRSLGFRLASSPLPPRSPELNYNSYCRRFPETMPAPFSLYEERHGFKQRLKQRRALRRVVKTSTLLRARSGAQQL